MTAKRLNKKSSRRPTADLSGLSRVFTIPEADHSTLSKIEKAISENIQEFLTQTIVADVAAPKDLEKDFLDSNIPEEPIFVSEQAEFLMNKVVARSVHTASPRFVGHMTSALPYFMLPLAKIMVGLNQNTVKIETSKAFTPLERQVLGMMHRLIYQRGEDFYQRHIQSRHFSLGAFCSGGTIANLTGLWVARNKLFAPKPELKFAGVAQDGWVRALKAYGFEDAAIIVSERGHYSLKKSVNILGIGQNQLWQIETDANNKIRLDLLRKKLEFARAEKIAIIAVVGVAGTTETGSVDPLEQIAEICKEFGCCFHVDAAWGGPTLFSDQYRHLLRGIEKADSVVIDAHKQLYVPMGAGLVLFRDHDALNFIEHQANYVIRPGSRDLGKHTLEGSKPGMALMVHSGLRVLGRKGYELLIDLGIDKAKRFAETLNSLEDFELISAPELNLLTYRYLPADAKKLLDSNLDLKSKSTLLDKLNHLTVEIQKKQRSDGKSFVSRTRLTPEKYRGKEIDVFRVVLANPLTTDEILNEILEEQRRIAKKIWKTTEL